MADEVEMSDLSTKPSQPAIVDDKPGGRLNLDANQEQAVTMWAYAATIILLLLATPMIFFPSLLLYVSETSIQRRNALTPLESFLCLNSGILLVAFALALLFNAPAGTALPLTNRTKQPHPLLMPLSIASSLVALCSYNTTTVGALAIIVFLASLTMGVWGLWTLMFSGTSYISRKTGADKRTSRFLFGNKAAASSQKKEWKKGQARVQ